MVSLSAYLNFPKFIVPFCSQYREHPSFHLPSAFVPPHHFPAAIHLERGIQVSQRLLTIRDKYVVFTHNERSPLSALVPCAGHPARLHARAGYFLMRG